MTDDWKVPDDLADRVANANYADAWRLEIERTAQVRGILTDLIAELRRTTKGYLSPRAYAITVEQQREMADAAEAQLREAMRNDE